MRKLCCVPLLVGGCSLFRVNAAPAPDVPIHRSPVMTDPGLFGLSGDEWITLLTGIGTVLAVVGHRMYAMKKGAYTNGAKK